MAASAKLPRSGPTSQEDRPDAETARREPFREWPIVRGRVDSWRTLPPMVRILARRVRESATRAALLKPESDRRTADDRREQMPPPKRARSRRRCGSIALTRT